MPRKHLRCDFVSKKNALLVISGILIAVSFSYFSFSPAGRDTFRSYSEEAFLHKLIKSTGGVYKSASITGWVRVESATDTYDPEKLAVNIAELLDLSESNRKVENWQNQFARGSKIEGFLKGGQAVSVLGQNMQVQQGKNVTHAMVSLEGIENRKSGFYKSKISEAIDRYGEGQVGLTCFGVIENDLSGEELLIAAEKMMAAAGASVQEKTVKDNLVSLTGFSPRFIRDVTYAGKEINLNVALRSNPAQNVTYVYVATPVIFAEY
ncbi:YwmB family TATA-box binding protein [Pelotomaculum propionicicum]|uniref:YwmB family TATA-box binding protein n=1 Tax=Pelotomaculum propionicicum TaxID=258475 RepID=UPI003B7B5BA1